MRAVRARREARRYGAPRVTLAPQELVEAFEEANRRMVGTGGTRPVYHPSGSQQHIDRVGSCGERALLKHLGLPLSAWTGRGNLGAGDVYGFLDVRASDLGLDRPLLIRETDKARRLVILALDCEGWPGSSMTEWELAGWLRVLTGQRPGWRRMNGLYYVPQVALRPMAELPAEIARRSDDCDT